MSAAYWFTFTALPLFFYKLLKLSGLCWYKCHIYYTMHIFHKPHFLRHVFRSQVLMNNLELLNPFHVIAFFLYTLKTSENLWFSDVFREYRERPVSWNRLRKYVKQVYLSCSNLPIFRYCLCDFFSGNSFDNKIPIEDRIY